VNLCGVLVQFRRLPVFILSRAQFFFKENRYFQSANTRKRETNAHIIVAPKLFLLDISLKEAVFRSFQVRRVYSFYCDSGFFWGAHELHAGLVFIKGGNMKFIGAGIGTGETHLFSGHFI
jgi:hypothetical protein